MCKTNKFDIVKITGKDVSALCIQKKDVVNSHGEQLSAAGFGIVASHKERNLAVITDLRPQKTVQVLYAAVAEHFLKLRRQQRIVGNIEHGFLGKNLRQ